MQPVALADAPFEVSITWNSDPRETYPRFNPELRELETQREPIAVTWTTNAGELFYEAPDFASERKRQALATWAPGGGSDASLWAIIRDSRGAAVALRLDAKR